jgi:DNA-binding response OmpR family regulator
LLSNAFKFTGSGGSITVQLIRATLKSEEFAEIKIADTGIGIAKDKLEKIFDRFFQADDSSRKTYGGSGIGLALVKELVELHKWEISVESEQGKGTQFYLQIPLRDNYLDENEKIIEVKSQLFHGDDSFEKKFSSKNADAIEKEIEKEIIEKNKLLGDKPSILIVEDSEDVRFFVKGILQNDYRIYEAIDGEDGLKKSAEITPALIISDVMMPSMDGIEFCKRIKTNLQTSHIPIILLTAKASQESKIEGLETGADDYLTKPFNSKELSVRIKNLLEQRKNLREKFNKEIKIDTSTIAVTSLDNEFLQKALDVAEKNLSNTEFNSEDFAKEMFMSRSQLHRKLVTVTEHGPGEFIRTFRLKKAAELILEKRLSITQIAFEVGFSSPSHFTKAFRQTFNCLPTEFIGKTNS